MTDTCPVCRETIEGPNSAVCDGCGQPYHLRVDTNTPGKDCGDVWIDGQTLALRFACAVCLGRDEALRAPQGHRCEAGEPPLGRAH